MFDRMHDIANGITFARHHAGLSQRQAAERSGYSLRSIQMWEQGKHEMSFSAAIALADVYDTTLNTMAGRTVPDAWRNKIR